MAAGLPVCEKRVNVKSCFLKPDANPVMREIRCDCAMFWLPGTVRQRQLRNVTEISRK